MALRLLVLISLLAGTQPLVAGDLTAEEARGKQIFLHGTSPSGVEVTALMGDDAVEVPAAALPCSSCHGHDGHGRPEGGVSPSDLTWEALTKPYGVRHDTGREHPPYAPKDLKKAIAMGFDPAGNRLNITMPRYRMTIQDMNDLIAYIQKLGTDLDPGIEESRLRIATVLPPAGAGGGVGDAVAAVLKAYFSQLSSEGGLYGRSVELVIRRASAAEPTPQAALEALVAEEEIFALVAPMISGAESAVAALAHDEQIPVIGPFAQIPQIGFPLNRAVFYVYSGLALQGRVVAKLAAESDGATAPAALVYAAEDSMEPVADAVAKEAAASGWATLERRAVAPDTDLRKLVEDLAGRGVETVFFFDTGAVASTFFAAAQTLGYTPSIYAAGSQLGREAFAAPAAFDGKIFLAFATLPADASPRGLDAYRKLAATHALPKVHHAAQISALAAAELLVEGLKKAGRELSRERLIMTLEGLYDHPTGLTPPVSFGPNRRIGAQGAYVVAVDLVGQSFQPVTGWVEIR